MPSTSALGASRIRAVGRRQPPATLARQDGRRARLDNDWYRIGEALRDIEKEYGLQHFRERLAEESRPTGYRSWDEAVAETRARREAGQ